MAIKELDQSTVNGIYNRLIFTSDAKSKLVDKKTIVSTSNKLTSLQNSFNVFFTSISNSTKLTEFESNRTKSLKRESDIESTRFTGLNESEKFSNVITSLGILSIALESVTKKLADLDLSKNAVCDIDVDTRRRRFGGRISTKVKLGAGLGVVGAGLDVVSRLSEGQSLGQTAVGVGGGLAGAAAGGALGAKAGAGIGAFFGGVGAAPGAAIGGLIGGIGGYFAGGSLADRGYEAATRTQLSEASYSSQLTKFITRTIQNASILSPITSSIVGGITAGSKAIESFFGDGEDVIPNKSVLDAIAKAEGTYNTGYNTSLGYGKFLPGGREQNLTNLTLEQILELGRYMRKQKGNPNSSALGRYQIVGTTLQDAAKALKLDLKTTKFTPEVQDQMAMWILKKQGFRAWEGFKKNPEYLIAARNAMQNQSQTEVSPQSSPGAGRISSGFRSQRRPGHQGIDYAAPTGTPVYALQSGKVTIARSLRGYGNVVYIQQDNGYETRYAHLSAIDVKEGQTVSAEQLIGKVGSTGRSSGPHLHFEVRKDGIIQDPTNTFKSNPWIVGGKKKQEAKPEQRIDPRFMKPYDGMLLDPKKRRTRTVVVEKPVYVPVPMKTGSPSRSTRAPRGSGNRSVNYYTN